MVFRIPDEPQKVEKLLDGWRRAEATGFAGHMGVGPFCDGAQLFHAGVDIAEIWSGIVFEIDDRTGKVIRG